MSDAINTFLGWLTFYIIVGTIAYLWISDKWKKRKSKSKGAPRNRSGKQNAPNVGDRIKIMIDGAECEAVVTRKPEQHKKPEEKKYIPLIYR